MPGNLPELKDFLQPSRRKLLLLIIFFAFAIIGLLLWYVATRWAAGVLDTSCPYPANAQIFSGIAHALLLPLALVLAIPLVVILFLFRYSVPPEFIIPAVLLQLAFSYYNSAYLARELADRQVTDEELNRVILIFMALVLLATAPLMMCSFRFAIT